MQVKSIFLPALSYHEVLIALFRLFLIGFDRFHYISLFSEWTVIFLLIFLYTIPKDIQSMGPEYQKRFFIGNLTYNGFPFMLTCKIIHFYFSFIKKMTPTHFRIMRWVTVNKLNMAKINPF